MTSDVTLEDVFAHELEVSMTQYANVCEKCGLLLATWKRELDPIVDKSRERRERIATAALSGMTARGPHNSFESVASECLAYADALIAALDGEGK